MAGNSASGGMTRRRTAVQSAALPVGVVFVLVRVAGFLPRISSEFSQLRFAATRAAE